MNVIDTSYSTVFQCDSRTTLSIGLSLLVAIATAVALGVLAYYGYITPTTAYGLTPTIGAALTVIGVASAFIRKDTPLKSRVIPSSLQVDPERDVGASKSAKVQDSVQIAKDLNVARNVQVVPYSKTQYARHQGPVQGAPYHCLKVQIAFGGMTEPVEVEVLEVRCYSANCYKMTFQYADTHYIKDIVKGEKLESLWKEHVRNTPNFLLREDYKRLNDARGPATLFMLSEEKGKAFFNQERFSEVTHEGNVVTFTRTHTAPIRSLEGLDHFPEICAQLQALSWTWEAPQPISLLGRGEKLPSDMVYSLRVEWPMEG